MKFPVHATAALALVLSACSNQDAPPPQAEEDREVQARDAYQNMPDTAGTGSYPAIKEEDPGLRDHTVYRPGDLASIPDGTLGVVGWGNGGCSDDGASQRLHLAEIASHGYVVVAPGKILSGPGRTPPPHRDELIAETSPEQLMQGVEWAIAQNKNPESPYFGKIDPSQIAVAGFSCGGLQAVALGSDPRVKAVIVQNSGVFPPSNPGMEGLEVDKSMLDRFHTPVLYLNGGPSDIAYENGMDDYERIKNVPVAMINHDTGHGGTYNEPNGGANAQVVVNWLNWQLRGDAKAGNWFVGEDCEICTRDGWTILRKNGFPGTPD